MISYLRTFLSNFTKEARLYYEITLIEPPRRHDRLLYLPCSCIECMLMPSSSTTVTCGSVLNHMHMGNSRGEARLAHSSFGFLRIEEHDPDEWRGHEGAEPFQDKFDGRWYVKVINYFIVKVRYISWHERLSPALIPYRTTQSCAKPPSSRADRFIHLK